ncbi:MAG: copper chaperone PCu(A)C [Thiohalocapsa sp.]|nr:copper chaperone PCu(A)C [Thiohalocapsa sp.]MCF7991713.1 copper chaperone PCu(A)C [Thiohalocapsa sp.]
MRKTLAAAWLISSGFGLFGQAALAGDALNVGDPYARAVPPGQPNSAVFMQIENGGSEDRALVSAQSPAADVVELHTHRMQDGMMQMRRVERIALPAGETVTLEPGGLHVMLIGLKQQLSPGDEVDLTLGLDDGSSVVLTAPVRKVEPMSMKGHEHGAH